MHKSVTGKRRKGVIEDGVYTNVIQKPILKKSFWHNSIQLFVQLFPICACDTQTITKYISNICLKMHCAIKQNVIKYKQFEVSIVKVVRNS